MCAALSDFVESADHGARYEVTLITDWAETPVIACRQSEKPPEKALCEYLIENSSMEYMTANVQRVLTCIDPDFPSSAESLYFKTLAGTAVSRKPAFTQDEVEMTISFDTSSDEEPPHMTISINK